ncbi:MAG: bifunctional D-glycero-beta-D-manno-heptose-7-phosphate kinase/D-glycero-beta-D-manno-heptose 1-phosphate adenylyltransferase HldE [Gammaproteobacteria bacterium]|nr:MAG: bifunctional D-glycero-beta-D-manno-heptose-7-phosphate kinase/D-glycero-beta-D-manno-heptose 1-phosphate adenylyltransferase HldE [Gammaproteobacteria bacterium]
MHLPSFESAKVLVVGDLMLDRYWHGGTSRISPEAPVPVVHVNENEERAGGACNVALNIATLGAQCTVMGLCGDDEAAATLEILLEKAGVNPKFVRMPENATVTKLRVMSRSQQLMRLDFEDGFIGQDLSRLEKDFESQLKDHNIVVCSDYGKGSLRQVKRLIEMCNEKNIPVLVDPKGSDFEKYTGASLITPNLSEFETVVGSCETEDDLVAKADRLSKQFNIEALLVTRSEHGMSLMQQGYDPVHIPTQAREVFDVTGAGDTVISTLAASLGAGVSLERAMVLSNLAAGVVVAKSGTASVSLSELENAIEQNSSNTEHGILEEAELYPLLDRCRARGETIIMTNGCFDILHAGHVTYLEQASALGDRLLVAVNIDETVRRLKGEDRPVNKVENRMRMLAALRCVDWVIAFVEDEPTRLICDVSPDILVKGGDNEADKIPGGDCVREAGGQVMVLTYVDGISTTKIIESIKEK